MRKKRNQSRSQENPLPGAAPDPKRVTPVDIQQKEFRLAVRGYNEREVDQFLDEVTEEIARLYAENKRLREELDILRRSRPAAPGTDEAELLVSRARDEAVRIISEARARVSAMAARVPAAGYQGGAESAPAVGSGLVGTFLAREREFLQGMAGLIQRHAEAIKGDVRRVRQPAPAAPSGPAPEVSPGPAPPEEHVEPAGAGDPAEASEADGEPQQAAGTPDLGSGGDVRPDLPTPYGRPSETGEEAGTPVHGAGMPSGESGMVLETPGTVLEDGPADQDVVDLTGGPGRAEASAIEDEPGDDSGSDDLGPDEPGPDDLGSDEPGPDLGPQELSEAFATHVGASLGTSRETAAGPKMEPAPDDDETGAERSLRELFWGED